MKLKKNVFQILILIVFVTNTACKKNKEPTVNLSDLVTVMNIKWWWINVPSNKKITDLQAYFVNAVTPSTIIKKENSTKKVNGKRVKIFVSNIDQKIIRCTIISDNNFNKIEMPNKFHGLKQSFSVSTGSLISPGDFAIKYSKNNRITTTKHIIRENEIGLAFSFGNRLN